MILMTSMHLNGVFGMVCKAKKKLNFRIVEGYEPDVDYEEFKKDFLNPYILVDELREKYNITPRKYNEYRARVLKETGLWRKPNVTQQRFLKGLPLSQDCRCAEYIQNVNGDFIVVKTICYDTHYYGRYTNFETALKVRDILIENNWDKELGEELKKLYGKKRLRPSLEKAKELYDEYEYRYFHEKDSLLDDIKKEMGISKATYHYMLMLLREKHGKKVNRWMYD